jgi:hypothetical protein
MRDFSSIARLEGPSLTLRSIESEDAANVLGLRSNHDDTKFRTFLATSGETL